MITGEERKKETKKEIGKNEREEEDERGIEEEDERERERQRNYNPVERNEEKKKEGIRVGDFFSTLLGLFFMRTMKPRSLD